MPNRLANESSPYLRQHQDNPVDWYPWGPEAFTRALLEDKPVFLSVGYSSCHWCHVMEHESFADPEVAAVLNRYFVSVKVDREELPHVDEAYMAALQVMSGRGGWPMSVFLTPQKRPFFAGTYFPRHPKGQFPGIIELLTSLATVWQERRNEVEASAEQVANALREVNAKVAPVDPDLTLSMDVVMAVLSRLAQDFDAERGGFGDAPKFPPHSALELLQMMVMTEGIEDEARQTAAVIAGTTLRAMCLGGIHDHVGGGFHRYSTDGDWRLPHFEKMLYDNALMVSNLAMGHHLFAGAPELSTAFLRAAERTIAFMERELALGDGLYGSAIDADSEGEEGRYYVWSTAEIRMILGDRAEAFIKAFQLEDSGNFADEASGVKTGANVLCLKEEVGERFDSELAELLAARERRPRPMRDHKAIVGWNALAVKGFLRAGRIDLAEATLKALLDARERHGSLPHMVVDGEPSGAGYLEDYAPCVVALFEYGFATDNESFLRLGTTLADEMVLRFEDERGGFYGTSTEHEELFGRTKPFTDQPIPSPNALALSAMLMLGDEERLRRGLMAFLGWMVRMPQATEALAQVLMLYVTRREDLGEDVTPELDEAPDLLTRQAVTEVRLSSRETPVGVDGWAEVEVVLHVPDGLHLNANPAAERYLRPTKVEVVPLRFEASYPSSENGRYVGEVRIGLRLELPTSESGADFEVEVEMQECTETECHEPRTVRLSGVIYRP